MSNEWTTLTLGEITAESKERIGSSTNQSPVYGVDRSVGLTPTPKYASANLSRYKRVCQGMFAYNPMRLNIGSIGYCSSQHKPGLVSPDYIVFRCDTDRLDPDFLNYYIHSTAWNEWTELAGVGSVRMRIYYRELARMPITLPPLAEQRAIARFLGTLDDKIELNRRMNETLEEMARALFKSWFVDFDPVRAKAEGRDPGLLADIAGLFPDSFEDSELGEIPRGWCVGNVSCLAVLSRTSINPGKLPDEVFDHFSIPAFDEGQMPIAELGASIKSNKFVVPDQSVLVSKLNPRIPRVWLPSTSSEYQSICSTEFLVVLPQDGVSREFLYSYLSSDAFSVVFQSLVTGTSGSHQRVKPDNLFTMDAVVPTDSVIREFTRNVKPFLARIATGKEESATLSALRDTLLPKLISGELRVGDAERLVGSAV